LCAHHLVPFHGTAYVGYVPGERIAGLSKFARAVKYQAKGFWVQEELTTAIAEMIEEELNPLGTAVVIKAEHLCMAMRGVQQPGVITTTSAMRGVFADHSRTAKAEFMQYLGDNCWKSPCSSRRPRRLSWTDTAGFQSRVGVWAFSVGLSRG